MSTREAAIEAARMCVLSHVYRCPRFNIIALTYSIYLVHDDSKEKEFELEMSWIGDETGGLHLPVPQELHDEAEQKAKDALESFAE